MDRRVWLASLAGAAVLAAAALYLAEGRTPAGSGASGPAASGVAPAAAPVLVGKSNLRGFQVTLRPGSNPIAVNEMLSWVISVRDANGKPVTGAVVDFDAQMPAHGHGLPTAPRVTGESAPGDYTLEGLRFSMRGYWTIRVNITSEDRTDTVDLDLQL